MVRDVKSKTLEEMFSDYQEFYKEGIKIYDYKGNYIRTVAGTKDE